MDTERRQPSRSHRWLLIASALSLLASACVQDANDVAEAVAGGTVTVAAGNDAGVATSVVTTTGTATTLSTSGLSPSLRVVLEQFVGGSLLDPQLSEDGLIEPPAEASRMNSIAVGPAGLIAVGDAREAATGNLDAAVWTSPDGREWTRVVDELGVFGDAASPFDDQPEQSIVDVVAGPEGVLAVGTDGTLLDNDAAVWFSADGSIWERAVPDSAVFGGEGDQLINAVVEQDGQWIAVGESAERATVWNSTDGRQWARAEVVDADAGPSIMNDVTPFDGGFVAVGSAGVNLCPAVWLSPDGQTWNGISADMAGSLSGFAAEECPLSPMQGVVSAGRGLVAIGTRLLPDEDPTYVDITTGGPLIWTSVDGYRWVLEDAVFVPATDIDSKYGYLKHQAPILLEHVVSDGTRLYAAGTYELILSANDLPGFATLWYSEDGGVTWLMAAEATLPPSGVTAGARGLCLFDEGLALIGIDAAPAGKHPEYGWMTWSQTPAVWIAQLPDQ